MKPITLIAALLFTATAGFAQQLNIPKGKAFEITSYNKQAGTFKQEHKNTYAFKSLGKDADGNNILEAKLVQVYIYDFNSKKVLLNTDSIRKTNFYSTETLQPLALLYKPFTVIVSPKGEIVKIDGVEQTLRQVLSSWHIENDYIEQQISNAKNGFALEMGEFFFKQPDAGTPAKIPTKADKKTTELPYNMISNVGGTVTMQSNSKSDSGTYDRKYLLDAQTGLVKRSLKVQDTHYKVPPEANIRGGEMVIRSTSTLTMADPQVRKPVDTAWLNMANKYSSWSDYFKKGTKADSVKIYNLVKHPDPRFADDPVYTNAILGALQSIRGDHSYLVYDSLLAKTPDRLLDGNRSHLHNKLHESRKQGPEALYSTAKYAAKAGSLPDWIQDSYSQGFLDYDEDDNGRAERVARDYKSLQYLIDRKDKDISDIITPMYIWAMAKQKKGDLDNMKQAAIDLKTMDDKHVKAGNGARYSLLVYQMLADAHQPTAANDLLEATIQKLEQYTADTLNKERYQHQNMLAGAYYFKYEALNKASNPDAAKYLALAAKYSPRSPKEKAYASFYDRAFLKTKESYREVFIQKMLNAGNEEEALSMFAEHVTAMPENVLQMKEMYGKKFPEKNFKDFFISRVVNKWEDAPAFALKNIDGSQHNLADYKGKWLVLDFWGTWCGPCCEELPTVNKFSEKVKAGEYKDVNFLSVSCYDKEDRLKAFLTENKYSLPVAVSDGKIQQNYKIKGYPSKIIVSPDGKMITVDFGKDWQSVIKSFSQM